MKTNSHAQEQRRRKKEKGRERESEESGESCRKVVSSVDWPRLVCMVGQAVSIAVWSSCGRTEVAGHFAQSAPSNASDKMLVETGLSKYWKLDTLSETEPERRRLPLLLSLKCTLS